ncbi:unnamed protein product [Oppiella nova]|uniref:ABC transporter domain-containing protein n=1 Tax=Oppiella nova TaxID=334625 RepID=A0A7R9LKP7_9ACAR|nr:unnamed protein product [Oppiella nova]CAG2164602.1 unnamed protein product [Oppiella nova]
MIPIRHTIPTTDDRLKLYWNGLTYKTSDNKKLISRNKTNVKTIINDLNGEITSGQLTGILGPSGSGKTTLIECLAGRRVAGLSGRVWVKSSNDKKIKLRIAYNGQTLRDHLLDCHALREFMRRLEFFFLQLLRWLSRVWLYTGADNQVNCELMEPLTDNKSQSDVHKMLSVFGLLGCARVKTGAISGGQKKRLSIALELIFSPNILLLDEPTTGLDSASSFQCLSLLKTLSYNKEPLVIAMSIHQPTARLLAFFDSIYVLSMDGRCIYSGPTDRLITHLSDFGFNCPVFHNPADFVMEISSGAHEPDAIDRLAIYESQNHTLESIKLSKPDTIIGVGKGIKNKPTTKSYRTVKDQLRDAWILLKRAHLVFIRNPFMIWLRLFVMVLALPCEYAIFSGTRRGQLDTACLNSESVMVKIMSIVDNKSTTNETFNNLSDVGYIVSTMLFIHFNAIVPTLMTFPIELNTFVKEHFNKWYTCWSYFTARSLVDIPLVLVISVIYATIMWWMTDQVWDGWRFSVHQLVMILLALVSHSLGLLLSAIFMNDIRASILSLTTIVTALLLFSGSLIPVRILPSYLQTLSYLSIFRLTYESMLIILYGFNRCPTLNDPLTMDSLTHEFGVNMYHMEECLEGADNLANVTRNSLSGISRLVAKQNPSRILEWFDLQDRDLYIYISLFIAYTVTLRWLAYYALKWRARIQ